MMEFIESIVPNFARGSGELGRAIIQTLQMVGISGLVSFILGTALGVGLVVMRKGGICQSLVAYNILDKAINILRSIPFLILIFMLMGLSRLIMGTAIGVAGAIVPLVVGTVPFFSRQIETALSEVPHGLIEASTAMGVSRLGVIFRVYLRESIPSITRVTQITAINLVNLATFAGAVGAGGLGDFALRFGHQLNMRDLMWLTIVIILILVSLIQATGNIIIKRTTH